VKFKGRKCQSYTSRSQASSTTISIQNETYTQTAHLANETNTIQQKYKNTHSCHISRWRVDAISWWASNTKAFLVSFTPICAAVFPVMDSHSTHIHAAAAVQYLSLIWAPFCYWSGLSRLSIICPASNGEQLVARVLYYWRRFELYWCVEFVFNQNPSARWHKSEITVTPVQHVSNDSTHIP